MNWDIFCRWTGRLFGTLLVLTLVLALVYVLKVLALAVFS